jgi:hypothetical protein
MNTIIIIIAIVGSVVISPVVAINVPPVREVLFGMVSKESILTLADKVDTSRIENERKLAAISQELDSAKQTVAEQKLVLDKQANELKAQGVDISNVKDKIEVVKESIVSQKDCSSDIAKYCYTSSFKDPAEFKNFLKAYEKMDNYNDYKKKFTKEFDDCQKALKCS